MKSKTIPKNIREKNAEFREIIAKLEAAEGNEEAGFIPRPLGMNFLVEDGISFMNEVCQNGDFPVYDPNVKLNIEAMLPCAFARSEKMMRFISAAYDEDKEKFYQAGQKSSRKNSRFISANRIAIRLNAIKAQGVYMASLEDKDLARKLLEHAERSFSHLANSIKDYEHYPVSYGVILQKSIDKIGGSDDGLHDFTALFVYFCNSFNQTIDEEDSNWQSSMITIGSKEQYNLSSYDKVQEEIIEESGQMAKDVQKDFRTNAAEGGSWKVFC